MGKAPKGKEQCKGPHAQRQAAQTPLGQNLVLKMPPPLQEQAVLIMCLITSPSSETLVPGSSNAMSPLLGASAGLDLDGT
eukprot:3394427-Amphidinium_carterae.1